MVILALADHPGILTARARRPFLPYRAALIVPFERTGKAYVYTETFRLCCQDALEAESLPGSLCVAVQKHPLTWQYHLFCVLSSEQLYADESAGTSAVATMSRADRRTSDVRTAATRSFCDSRSDKVRAMQLHIA